jgi:hypothetical protein
MKMKNVYSLPVILSLLVLSSCYKDKFKARHPDVATTNSCDTTSVISYSAQIAPIMSTNCNQNCHNPTASSGNRDLTTYSGVSSGAIAGALYGTVSWDPAYGNDMPKNGNKLSICDITKIKKWAAAGAPNN